MNIRLNLHRCSDLPASPEYFNPDICSLHDYLQGQKIKGVTRFYAPWCAPQYDGSTTPIRLPVRIGRRHKQNSGIRPHSWVGTGIQRTDTRRKVYSRRRDTLPKPAEGDLAPSNWDLPTDEGQGLEGQNR